MQVRDILFIEDLVDALLLAGKRIHQISGEAFNMGGGPQNTISLIELLNIITELQGRRPATAAREWRPGDQRYYASNTGKFRSLTDWTPRVDAYSGVKQLYLWLLQNHTGAGRTIMHAQKVSI
jgi:CDP-paratose 2-epimerase